VVLVQSCFQNALLDARRDAASDPIRGHDPAWLQLSRNAYLMGGWGPDLPKD
jgi:hypothetical protein